MGSAPPVRLAHLTTVDMSLALLLGTELEVDRAAGFDVVGVSAPGPYVDEVTARGVTHVAVPSLGRAWGPRDDVRAARELAAALHGLDLDVLHTHTPKAGVLGRLLGRWLGVPVVVNTNHGLWVQPGDPWPRQAFVLAAETVAGRASHAELYQNDDDRRRLARLVGAGTQRTVGNGIDLDRFAFDPGARARVRAELGVGDDEVLVGGVGRRVAEKGLPEFAAAARALAGHARFVWVGPDDPEKPDAVAEAEAGVEVLGARGDMPAVYAALDVFCLPSHREGFSRSAMEAAAGRCALVLTDIRGCREIGAPGRHARFVPPRDPDALTAALSEVIGDTAVRDRLARAAETRAWEAFDQRAVARRSIGTYARVALERGHRDLAQRLQDGLREVTP